MQRCTRPPDMSFVLHRRSSARALTSLHTLHGSLPTSSPPNCTGQYVHYDHNTSCRTPADAPDTSGRTPCTCRTGLACRLQPSTSTCGAAVVMPITLHFYEEFAH